MINLFKSVLLLVLPLVVSLFITLPASVSALDCASPQTAQEAEQCGACHASGVSDANCGNAPTQSTDTINNTIRNIINITTVIAGIIAVIMLIVGGVRYVTSSGNDQAVASAKKTILYAIIGLIIVAIAQVVAKFTLHQVTKP